MRKSKQKKSKILKLKQPNEISISCSLFAMKENLDIIFITNKNNIQLILNLNLINL